MGAQKLLAVVMTDLVGSTETVARLGAQAGERWRQQHISVLREVLAKTDGREVQMLGDGILAVFESASAAVEFAASAQRRILLANSRRDAISPSSVRVGISIGEVTQDSEGVHGLVVVEAARLCAAARGGQVLANALVELLCAGRAELRFSAQGALELKGLPAPLNAVELGWESARGASAIPLPPPLLAVAGSAFVGRTAERERLTVGWTSARGGERRIALVAGEPGIGKTRLAAELAQEAATTGAIVLYGRCDEDLSAPFQPWVQALRHYLAHADPSALREELADAAPDLLRLLPELQRIVPGVTAPAADPENDRLRVFDAIDELLASASQAAPLLVVLDDLHWADKPSLALLRHLVRSTRPAALLLLGTYRETDLVRTHPLAEMLADLRREPSVERVLLRGLDEAETTALLEARAAHEVPAAFARALHSETAGNPFFLEEVLRHLAETGALRQEGERWTSDRRIEELGIPEGVREVVGRRLSRLSETANQALAVAAVIGRDFDSTTIEAAGGPAGDALLDALDEAARARLIEEVAGTHGHYSFAHALVRQTLYEELGTTRRVRLHWRIGDALEKRFASAPDDQLGAIAYHLCEGALAGDPLRAVDASQRAARRAEALGGHEEAITQAQRALGLLDHAGLDEPERRYELLMTLGEALIMLAGDFPTPFLEAAGLARQHGWATREARALVGASALLRLEAPGLHEMVGYIEQALASLPIGDGVERCLLLARLAIVSSMIEDATKLHSLADEALAMARRLGGPEELGVAVSAKQFHLLGTPDVEQIESLAAEVGRIAEATGQHRQALAATRSLVTASVLRADRSAFERHSEETRVRMQRARLRTGMYSEHSAADALAAGRFQEARSIASLTRGHYGRELSFVSVVIAARREEGRLEQVADGAEQFVASMPRWARAYSCVSVSSRAALGQLDAARAELDRLAPDGFVSLRRDWGWPLSLRHLAEACALLGDAERARMLEPLLSPYTGIMLVAFGTTLIEGAADRALGQVLATQERLDEAVSHYERALALEEGFGSTALAARTRYWWARALLERSAPGDRERARTLADACVATSSALGMAHLESSARELLAQSIT